MSSDADIICKLFENYYKNNSALSFGINSRNVRLEKY